MTNHRPVKNTVPYHILKDTSNLRVPSDPLGPVASESACTFLGGPPSATKVSLLLTAPSLLYSEGPLETLVYSHVFFI